MNFERIRRESEAEIADMEARCSAPFPDPLPESDAEIMAFVDGRLLDKIKLHCMKVDHGLLFGKDSPYFGMSW